MQKLREATKICSTKLRKLKENKRLTSTKLCRKLCNHEPHFITSPFSLMFNRKWEAQLVETISTWGSRLLPKMFSSLNKFTMRKELFTLITLKKTFRNIRDTVSFRDDSKEKNQLTIQNRKAEILIKIKCKDSNCLHCSVIIIRSSIVVGLARSMLLSSIKLHEKKPWQCYLQSLASKL